jgi:hypothetical protein
MSKRKFETKEEIRTCDKKEKKETVLELKDVVKAIQKCGHCRVIVWKSIIDDLSYDFENVYVIDDDDNDTEPEEDGDEDDFTRKRLDDPCISCKYVHDKYTVRDFILFHYPDVKKRFGFLFENQLMMQSESGSYHTLSFVFDKDAWVFDEDVMIMIRSYIMNSFPNNWYYRFRPCMEIWTILKEKDSEDVSGHLTDMLLELRLLTTVDKRGVVTPLIDVEYIANRMFDDDYSEITKTHYIPLYIQRGGAFLPEILSVTTEQRRKDLLVYVLEHYKDVIMEYPLYSLMHKGNICHDLLKTLMIAIGDSKPPIGNIMNGVAIYQPHLGVILVSQSLSVSQFTEELVLHPRRFTPYLSVRQSSQNKCLLYSDHVQKTRNWIQEYLYEFGVIFDIGLLISDYYIESPM